MCNHELKELDEKVCYKLKNDKELIVRLPREEDGKGLLNYIKEVDTETRFLAREPGEFSFTLDQEVGFINRIVADEDSQMFVGTIDGEIVSNCSVGLVMGNQRYRHRASLGIAVKKSCWGLGIGTYLMTECIKWCRNHGIEQLELEVVTQNERGIGLYKSLGFQKFGTKKHALKYSDGTYADEYYMILFIEK